MKKLILIFLVTISMTSFAFAGHQGIYIGNCTNCHIPNLIAQHGGFVGADCAKCHSSQDPTVIAIISKGIGGGIISCADCHGLATHTQKHGTYFQGWTAYPGVVPVRDPNAGAWTQGTGFTYLPNTDPYNKPTAQYQVCYACHSYYSLGPSPNGDGVYDIVGPSGFNLTDQAMEFNPKNKSAHPIEVTLNNQTGSYAPKALTSSQMLDPWKTYVGNQNMNCSDCHEVSNVQGPQGYSYQFALKGTRKYWPRNKTNGRLWTLGDLKNNQNNWKGDLFCANCHTLYNGNFMNKVHDKGDHNNDRYPDIGNIPDSEKYIGAPCVMCHLAIPHGAKRSRFIVYYDEPYPYQYKNTVTTGPDKWFSAYHNGMMGTMTGFKKTTASNYDKKNCYIPETETYGGSSRQPRWGCGDHESRDMTYDP